MKSMIDIGQDPYKTEGISKDLLRRFRRELDYRSNAFIGRVFAIVQREIQWILKPCRHHGKGIVCQVCEPMSQKMISSLNYQSKRRGRYRNGMAPLRKRRKRLHKKLAKRGFSASPTSIIWSSPTPGYGTQDTEFDFL